MLGFEIMEIRRAVLRLPLRGARHDATCDVTFCVRVPVLAEDEGFAGQSLIPQPLDPLALATMVGWPAAFLWGVFSFQVFWKGCTGVVNLGD